MPSSAAELDGAALREIGSSLSLAQTKIKPMSAGNQIAFFAFFPAYETDRKRTGYLFPLSVFTPVNRTSRCTNNTVKASYCLQVLHAPYINL